MLNALKAKGIVGVFACMFFISGMFGEVSYGSSRLAMPLLTSSANYDSGVCELMNSTGTPKIANAKSYSKIAGVVNESSTNETLRGTGYGAGRLWTGELVKMAAVTFYTPLRVVPRSKYKTWVKMNSSEANAQYFIRNHYNFTGMLSTWVSGATCEIGSNNQFMEVSEPDPSSSIAWTVPLFPIRATLERLVGSQYNNIVKWTHNYGRNVDWSNKGPAATTVGYAGMNSIHFLHNSPSELVVNMHARGTISYSFQHQIGATLYAGGFTVATPTVVAPIAVDR